MTKLLASVTVALLAVSLPAVLAGPGSGNGDTKPLKVEGVVSGVNVATGRIAITVRPGVTVVAVAGPTTKIERNGRRGTLAAFKIGDRGQALLINAGGAASKIEAVGP